MNGQPQSQHSPWNKAPQQKAEGQWCKGQLPLGPKGSAILHPCGWPKLGHSCTAMPGRGDMLEPRKAFSWQEKKGKLSAQKAEHRRFSRQESLLIEVTWDLGEKGKRRAGGTWSGFSFFCQSSYWAWWGGWKGKGLHDTKDTVQSWCQLGTLEYWVAGWGKGWGPLSPVPSRPSENDLFKAILLSESKAHH